MYISGDPVDLNTVFSITPTPTGTLAWSITPTGLATIAASTGMISAVAAGDLQVSVTETVGGITKTSNSMPFIVNAAISNPVTDIELITKGPFVFYEYFDVNSKITYADNTSDEKTASSLNAPWHFVIIGEPNDCSNTDSSTYYINTYECSNGYIKIRITTREFDKNGKQISKIYYILFGRLAVTSADSATIATPLTLTATAGETAITSGLTWAIKDTATAGVSIGGTNNNQLITTSAAQPGTVTVVASYTIPDLTAPTDATAETIPPPIIAVEQEITLSN